MKPARRRAFTLVELLVASAAAGLAMIAAAAAISAALRSFASVSASGDDGTRRVLMLAALEQDLASAMPLGGSSFAGEDDAMWPSADAARHWGAQAPGRTEAHTYPGAGHLFGAHDGWAGGFAMGGNRAGNEAALAASDTVLDTSLAAWHPAR